jgi:hypothetical protein
MAIVYDCVSMDSFESIFGKNSKVVAMIVTITDKRPDCSPKIQDLTNIDQHHFILTCQSTLYHQLLQTFNRSNVYTLIADCTI